MKSSLVSACLGLLFLAGCTVGPDYVPPQADVPDAWSAGGVSTAPADLTAWWRRFEDPSLTELVQRARDNNRDLERAVVRITEARARAGIAESQNFPNIEAEGAYARQRDSEEIVPGSQASNRFSAGLASTWELDLFGRIRRSVEAAHAGIGAAIEDYGAVQVCLFAEVARQYTFLRSLQTRLTIAHDNARTQGTSLRLAEARVRAGVAPDLDVAQARFNLATTESTIPALRAAITATTNRLAVLVGEPPQGVQKLLETRRPIPRPPAEVTVGVPADAVRQRPDVRRAERELAAQTARIGIATAELYPRFFLNGSFGFESDSVSSWFQSGSQAFGFGPSFRWNLFSGGRIRSQIRVEEARTDAARLAYEQAVLVSLEEVETAITSYVRERERLAALGRAVAAAERAVQLADGLYREGLTTFQNILDAQRTVLELQDERAQSQGSITSHLIAVYKALGGGWDGVAPAAFRNRPPAAPRGAPDAEVRGPTPAAEATS